MSQTASVACPACGVLNEVLVPDDTFDEQMKYAALQFACRDCGASLTQNPSTSANDAVTERK